MRRVSFDASRDQSTEIVDGSRDPGEEELLCMSCSRPTKRKTLSDLGARCAQCYEAYRVHPRPGPSISPTEPAAQNPRAWAFAMRAREMAGMRLSDLQKRLWREALHHEHTQACDAS